MTDQQHPITPPPELVKKWVSLACEYEGDETWQDLATEAARWGADQELKACVGEVYAYPGFEHPELFVEVLRAKRRPQPPSLKEQALEAMSRCDSEMWCEEMEYDLAIIRTALESLPS